MIKSDLRHELMKAVDPLSEKQQREVVNYARSLSEHPHGQPGVTLARFAGTCERADLDEMALAIEAGCERIDPHGW